MKAGKRTSSTMRLFFFIFPKIISTISFHFILMFQIALYTVNSSEKNQKKKYYRGKPRKRKGTKKEEEGTLNFVINSRRPKEEKEKPAKKSLEKSENLKK